MAVKAEKQEKSLKKKIHDYMMELSKISPCGVTDKHDEYYFHIKYFN